MDMARERADVRADNDVIYYINIERVNRLLQDYFVSGEVPDLVRIRQVIDFEALRADPNAVRNLKYIRLGRLQELVGQNRRLTNEEVVSCVDLDVFLEDVVPWVPVNLRGFLRIILEVIACVIIEEVASRMRESSGENAPPPYQESENGNLGVNPPNPPGNDLELALKIAAEAAGVKLQEERLYQLQKELSEKGHTYSYDELKDAIRVLNGTDIILKDDTETVESAFSPIETYGFAGEGKETKTFVKFSPLVTHSIKTGNFRMINYDKAMSFKSVIARQLHKRMSHNYIQASLTNPYEILLTTIIRDFGLTLQRRIQYNLDEVENALEMMKEKNVIINYKIDKTYELKPRRKLVDAKISIQPHPLFIDDIVKANKNAKRIRELSK